MTKADDHADAFQSFALICVQRVMNGRLAESVDAAVRALNLAPDRIEPVYTPGPSCISVTLRLAPGAVEETRAHFSAAFSETSDFALLPLAGLRKRLLICDMDSTIIGQECIDELADFAGRRGEISAITERAMAGELDFEAALRERVSMLAGLREADLQACFDQRITLTPGAKTLVATMKAHGAHTLLVSGGFTFFTERVARLAGFDAHFANELIVEDGRLTGAVGHPILGRAAKRERLEEALSAHGLLPEDAVAIGDGANDLAMIEHAGLGIGFRPHKVLRRAADAVIDGDSLETALYLQGYAREAFVSG